MKRECKYCRMFGTESCNRSHFPDNPACLKFKAVEWNVKCEYLVAYRNFDGAVTVKRFHSYKWKPKQLAELHYLYIKQAFEFVSAANELFEIGDTESEMQKMFYRAANAMRQAHEVRWWIDLYKQEGKL